MPFKEPESVRPVRAKMYVSGINYTTFGTTVRLQVVTRGEDNKQWSAATPVGHLELQIKNQSAADVFSPSQEWFVDLTPILGELAGIEGMEMEETA
jgi:hypothetical protein